MKNFRYIMIIIYMIILGLVFQSLIETTLPKKVTTCGRSRGERNDVCMCGCLDLKYNSGGK